MSFSTDCGTQTLTGTVSIDNDGTPQYGETLTANTSALNSTGTLSYLWFRGMVEISGASQSTYTLVADDVGNLIRVMVSSSDQSGSIGSSYTSQVGKADRSAPSQPEIDNVTYNMVALRASSNFEYAVDGGAWQSSAEFTGLSPETSYSFTMRYAENSIYLASPASSPLVVITLENPATPLAGTVNIDNDGTPQYDETLRANTSGITNNTGTLSYLWLRAGTAISGATEVDYTLVQEDIATTITVEVSSSVQSGSLTGGPTSIIGKADQAAPASPVLESKSYNTLILISTLGAEYAIDGGIWQNSREFISLNPETSYTLSQRLAETAIFNASPGSPGLNVTTDVAPANALSGSVGIDSDGSPQFGEQLSVNTSGITNNTGTLSYQWKQDGSDISGASQASYTLVQADIGTSITVVVSSSVEAGTLTGGPTLTIGKGDQSAPGSPVLESKNHNTIILVQISGAEYAIDGGPWQSSNLFNGLEPDTPYSLSQRFTDTETHAASPASQALSVSTDAAPAQTFTVTISVLNSANVPIQGALVNLSGYGTRTTNALGIATFEDVAPSTAISYNVSLEDYNACSGSLSVSDADVDESVVILATGMLPGTLSEVKVYPVPASTWLIIENVEGLTLALFSVTGELIELRTDCQFKETLDVSNWIPGIYIVKTEGFHRKFIVN